MLVPIQQQTPTGDIARRTLAVFGSTGSIGRSTLELVRSYPDQFKVEVLVAGSQVELLAEQAAEFKPSYVAIAREERLGDLRRLIGGRGGDLSEIEYVAGAEGIAQLAERVSIDVMIAAIVGIAGLPCVLGALRAGRTVALANKESLVAAGRLVKEALANGKGRLLPIDSEHSAIFQVLQGELEQDVEGITLTASGGPFLKTPVEELSLIRPEQAKKHPKWDMGAKISVDSATMFNKALEVIEAHWLFNLEAEKIEVLVHPQSIVHSLLRLNDGSQLAQLSVPDMRGAISYALQFPHGRLRRAVPALDLSLAGALEFFALDPDRFPAVRMAYDAIRMQGAASAVLNVANEVAVSAFLDGRIRFDHITNLVAEALEQFGSLNYATLEDLLAIEGDVRVFCVKKMREIN